MVIMGVVMILIVMVVVIPVLQDGTYNTMSENSPTEYATNTVTSGTYAPSSTGFTIGGTEIATVDDKEWVLMSDTLTILRVSSSQFRVLDFEEDTAVQLASIAIDSDAGTWSGTYSGTTYSGNIGANPVVRAASGTIGVYGTTAFYMDKDDEIHTSFYTGSFVAGGTSYTSAQVLISGTPGSLTVDGVVVTSSGGSTFLTGGTATISDGLTSPNSQVYRLSSVTIDVTFTVSDTSVTKSVTGVDIAAPINYTEVTDENGAIQSLLDIVPLLMVVGIFSTIIAVTVLRR